MGDLRKGWETYIEHHLETKVPAGRQRADKSRVTSRVRNTTPSSDEDDGKTEVCSLQSVWCIRMGRSW
jgi:hypothetical protein